MHIYLSLTNQIVYIVRIEAVCTFLLSGVHHVCCHMWKSIARQEQAKLAIVT